jgi:hypothetical protein
MEGTALLLAFGSYTSQVPLGCLTCTIPFSSIKDPLDTSENVVAPICDLGALMEKKVAFVEEEALL